MPLQIIHEDITKVRCDAIVNPTDCFYSGSGGTDLAIHTAAGKELDLACEALEPVGFGEVTATKGFQLPCKYILHTMGPVWHGGDENEAVILRSCYVNALLKAKRLGAETVAFPLISSGTFGFPKDQVLRIAIDAISDFLFTVDSELLIYICILNRNAFQLSKDIALKEYLNRNKRFIYENHALKMQYIRGVSSESTLRKEVDGEESGYSNCAFCEPIEPMECDGIPEPCSECVPELTCASGLMPSSPVPENISDVIKLHDDTFAVLLLKLIDRKGMGDVECYKKANVSKNTFWKINNDPKYKPSKPTVIAFAIALELSLEDTELLLRSAGFALAGNNFFDVIIEFYIRNRIYDVFEINAALYQYDQVCLGC